MSAPSDRLVPLLILTFLLSIFLAGYHALAPLTGQAAMRGSGVAVPDRADAGIDVSGIFGIDLSGVSQAFDPIGAVSHGRGLSPQFARHNGIDWAAVEAVRGRYDFTTTDVALQRVVAAGGRPVVIVQGTAPWARPDASYSVNGPFPDTYLPDYANFWKALVARYSQPPYNVRHWEVYNEPDNTNETLAPSMAAFGNYPDQYRKVLQTAYQAIKSVDPNATVLLGSVAHDFFNDALDAALIPMEQGGAGVFRRDFLDLVLAAGGGSFFDGLGFHYYPDYDARWLAKKPDLAPNPIAGKAEVLRDYLRKYGWDKPLYLTEVGTLSNPACAIPATPDNQARFVVKAFTRAGAAILQSAIWYRLTDNAAPNSGDCFAYNGLIASDGSLKPSFTAFQTTARQLGGRGFNRSLSSVDLGTSNIEGYLFRTAEDRDLRVLWSRSGVTETTVITGTPALTVTVKNGRSRVVTAGTLAVGGDPIFVESQTDTNPPVTIASPPGGTYSTGIVTVTLSANERATLYYTLNGSAPSVTTSPSGTLPLTLVLTQTRTLRYLGVDGAGNREPTKTLTYTIPPSGTIRINQGAPVVPSRAVTVEVVNPIGVTASAFSDDGATFAPFEPLAPARAWTLRSGDGIKTLYARFANGAGQVSAPVSATVTLDTVAPSASLSAAGGLTFTASSAVVLSPTASDATSGVAEMSFSNDGSGWSTWETYAISKSWTLSAGDGQKATSARFRDRAGNVSSPASMTWLLDTVAPTGTLTVNGGAKATTVPTVTLSISATDALGPITGMRLAVGSGLWGAWQPFGTDAVFTLPAGDGDKAISIQFQDEAGNLSDPVATGIRLDGAAGTTPSVTVNGGALWTNSTTATLTIGAPPGTTSMQVSDNDRFVDAAWQPFDTRSNWTLNSSASYDIPRGIHVRLRDGGGGTSAPLQDSIVYDPVAPTGTITVMLGSTAGAAERAPAPGTSLSVNISASKPPGLSPVTAMRVGAGTTFDQTSWMPFATSQTLTGSFTSTTLVYAQFRDGAGNVSSVVCLRADGLSCSVPPTMAMATLAPADGVTRTLIVPGNLGTVQVPAAAVGTASMTATVEVLAPPAGLPSLTVLAALAISFTRTADGSHVTDLNREVTLELSYAGLGLTDEQLALTDEQLALTDEQLAHLVIYNATRNSYLTTTLDRTRRVAIARTRQFSAFVLGVASGPVPRISLPVLPAGATGGS